MRMPSSSKGDDNDEKKTSWTYDGSEDEWDSFDRRIMRYMRKKYGSFGELLWQGDLGDYTLLHGQEFADYCERVWDAIELHDSTRAKEYWPTTSGFWAKKFQGKWRERQYVLLKDYIEEHARENAEWLSSTTMATLRISDSICINSLAQEAVAIFMFRKLSTKLDYLKMERQRSHMVWT